MQPKFNHQGYISIFLLNRTGQSPPPSLMYILPHSQTTCHSQRTGPEGSAVLAADDSAGGVLDLRRRDFCVIFQKPAV